MMMHVRHMDAPWNTVLVHAGTDKRDGKFYVMPQGACVAAWMGRNGNPEVSLYNWNKCTTPKENIHTEVRHQVQAHDGRESKCHSLDDYVVLTEHGKEELKRNPNKIVYKMTLACTGEGGNCERECGRLGPGLCGCPSESRKHHSCCGRVDILRTLRDVDQGQVRVSLTADHVLGQEAIPPSKSALRADPATAREMARDVAHGGTTSQKARGKGRALLVSSKDVNPCDASSTNTRYDPTNSTIENRAKHARRKESGSTGLSSLSGMNDWQKSNQFIRQKLIQAGIVLHFSDFPGKKGMLVIAPEWSLRMLRDHGGDLVATDCKHDTTKGKTMFSSLRCPSDKHGGMWFASSVWISEVDNGQTQRVALNAISTNVPCNDPACQHRSLDKWDRDEDGVWFYRRTRSCAPRMPYEPNPAWCPWVCHDKFRPSFSAVEAGAFRGSLLDDYHSYKAFSDAVLNSVGVSKEMASLLDWALRLYKRSSTDEIAGKMRTCFIEFILELCGDDQELALSARQAQDLIEYFDKYWAIPSSIRDAFIDKNFLKLRFETGCKHPASTGSVEGSHKHWDAIVMSSYINKNVLNVLMKLAGISMNGQPIPGFFRDEHNRYLHEQERRDGVDRHLRVMKAHLMFLKHADESALRCAAVFLQDDTQAWVMPFSDDCLKRHAEGVATKPKSRNFPESLTTMRERLGHGIVDDGVVRERFVDNGVPWYAVDRKTGQCWCVSSIKHGVCSARGGCKHDELTRLATRASASPQAFWEVLEECEGSLVRFVNSRERSKPAPMRCEPLFRASNRSELLAALAQHPSGERRSRV